MKNTKKPPNHKLRSLGLRAAGYFAIGIGTFGGFITYEAIIDWNNFKQSLENFILVQQDSVKLNMAVALPFLIAIIIFLLVTLRKNREFFKDKVSLSLLIAICVFYLIYSVVLETLAALIGAFVGALADETIFAPLSAREKRLAAEAHDMELEYEREKIRISARKKAQEDLDGSV